MVVPAAIRAELKAHAEAEAPNECCGLILVRDDVAVRYVPGVNKLASPYRYDLYIEPGVWAEINDDDTIDQAIFHSHPETQPIPSKTDQELSGLWGGRTFLIYGVKLDELRAWRFTRDEVEELPLSSS